MGRLLLGILPLLAWAQVRLEKVATESPQPTFITHAGDGTGRLFITLQRGIVRVLEPQPRTFLDISARVSCCGERGLFSIAFPPGFTEKRQFYVYYTDLLGDMTISRFRLDPSGLGDPLSEQIILKVEHRQFPNHNGGQLAFGPDGFLYAGTGDGGGGGDPFGNAQNPSSLSGKILRLDVERGADPQPEIWAIGLRNPWRFSFDRATGDLYIADVGQAQWEEINFQPAGTGAGRNYGWNRMEGLHCFQSGCSQAGLVLPVFEYTRGDGCSVTGGYVERGAYYYGDYCSGRIWALRREGGGWQNTLVADTTFTISTFGQDEAGGTYVADHATGDIYLLLDSPRIFAGGVVDAAAFEPRLAPGGLASVFGQAIAPLIGTANAASLPLPSDLRRVRVFVNGVAAPVLAVARTGTEQINFQVPWETQPGRAQVVVEVNGAASPAVDVDVLPAAPAVFPVPLSQDAQPGDIVSIWATGLGAVDNAPATGAAALAAPLSGTLVQPTVTVGGVPARVLFSGLAPGFVGLYQLNIELPRAESREVGISGL